jgi:small-conductance mechanosensitive channel
MHEFFMHFLHSHGFTDSGARAADSIVSQSLRIILILLVASVVARLGSSAVQRFVQSLHVRSPLRAASPRAQLRTTTMAGAMGRLVRLVAGIVAFLLVLGVIGINLAPLLAGAGIVGVALGFGAQTLVRDMLAGIFIIGEDQYGVGDIVDLGDAAGVVEDVNLRSTRVRSTDGTVWFVPNGEIKRAGNGSLDFSRAVVDVPLAYGPNLVKVAGILAEEAAGLGSDPAWSERLLESAEVWGVQALEATGPTMRVVVKTAPLAQAAVARELRRRITDRLLVADLGASLGGGSTGLPVGAAVPATGRGGPDEDQAPAGSDAPGAPGVEPNETPRTHDD